LATALYALLLISLRWHYPDQVKGSEHFQFFLSRVIPAPLIHMVYYQFNITLSFFQVYPVKADNI